MIGYNWDADEDADFKDIASKWKCNGIFDSRDTFDPEENSENLRLSFYGYYYF